MSYLNDVRNWSGRCMKCGHPHGETIVGLIHSYGTCKTVLGVYCTGCGIEAAKAYLGKRGISTYVAGSCEAFCECGCCKNSQIGSACNWTTYDIAILRWNGFDDFDEQVVPETTHICRDCRETGGREAIDFRFRQIMQTLDEDQKALDLVL